MTRPWSTCKINHQVEFFFSTLLDWQLEVSKNSLWDYIPILQQIQKNNTLDERWSLGPVETVCLDDWQLQAVSLILMDWCVNVFLRLICTHGVGGRLAEFPFTRPDIFCTWIHETSRLGKWIFDLRVYMLFHYSVHTSKARSVNIGLGPN